MGQGRHAQRPATEAASRETSLAAGDAAAGAAW